MRPVPGAADTPLAEALAATARAYRALARAAGGGSALRFEAAQSEVRASDARLVDAVDAITQRPLLIAAAPARSPGPEGTGTTGGTWLVLIFALSAFLVLLALTRALRRPPGPPEDQAAPPDESAPPPPRWDAPPTPRPTPL